MSKLMPKAKIYKPAKTAMQSGTGKTKEWVLEYEPKEANIVDNLMGWQGGSNTLKQVKLKFSSKESAIEYAEENDIEYIVKDPKKRKTIIKSYAENFTN